MFHDAWFTLCMPVIKWFLLIVWNAELLTNSTGPSFCISFIVRVVRSSLVSPFCKESSTKQAQKPYAWTTCVGPVEAHPKHMQLACQKIVCLNLSGLTRESLTVSQVPPN